MTRTVKTVIVVVLAVAAAAAIVSIVGVVVGHQSGVVYSPRQMMGPNGFRLPGQMGEGFGRMYGFGARGTFGGWGGFLVLPWISLALVAALAVALLVRGPQRAAPVAATTGTGPTGPREQFEQWHREAHAQNLAHEAITEEQPPGQAGQTPAADQPQPGAEQTAEPEPPAAAAESEAETQAT
jgi:hypothetical protein